MILILFDNNSRESLYPFTQLNAIANLRYGIFTAKERWQLISGLPAYIKTADYLSDLYESIPQDASSENEYLFIDAALKDEDTLRAQILSLQSGETLYDDTGLIAGRTTSLINDFNINKAGDYFHKKASVENCQRLQHPWQITQWNDVQLRKDFLLLFSRITTQPLSETNKIIQPENVIIEEGAVIEHCIINASTGPVYIAKNAFVMEGSMLRGPIAIGENAIIKMGTKIYGATTISPNCVAGGEMKNSIMQSYSNKAHHGYLGDAVIGSWCNLGAGTSNSNVKNSGNDVEVFHKASNKKINTGKKCGVIMGDYTRTSINTSINTGSIIGICCNIFGDGLTPAVVDDFSWGLKPPLIYTIDKAMKHISNWKAMKEKEFSAAEVSALKYIFDKHMQRLSAKASKTSIKNNR